MLQIFYLTRYFAKSGCTRLGISLGAQGTSVWYRRLDGDQIGHGIFVARLEIDRRQGATVGVCNSPV